MKWFYNLKISTKLIISFLLVAIIAGVVGFVGLMNISRINEADTLMYENNTMGINYSANAARFYQRMKYNIAESIILKDDSKRDKYATDISSFIDTIDEQLANYESTSISDETDREILKLSGQADLLYELISRFRLREDTVSRDKYGEMSPEVAKMLDNMTTKAKSGNALQEKGKQRTDVPKSAISLNDMDFGKY